MAVVAIREKVDSGLQSMWSPIASGYAHERHDQTVEPHNNVRSPEVVWVDDETALETLSLSDENMTCEDRSCLTQWI